MHGISAETASWEDSQRAAIANDGDFLQTFQGLKYINVALLTVLVYDHCLTFSTERERIWTLRWRLPKILFMVNRYFLPPLFFFEGLTNVAHVGPNICNARIFTPIPAFPALMTVELMLMLRVLALYENSKYMARFLIFQFLVQIIVVAILAGFILYQTRSIAGQDVFTGCLLSIPDWAYLSWSQPLIVESILVVLCFYRCRKYGAFSTTTKVLARDSIIYFLSITSLLTFNLVYCRNHILLGTALTMPTSVFSSIAAARLSMNIRALTMDQSFSTLAHESRFAPTLLFRRPGINHDERDVFPPTVSEEGPGELSQQDDREDLDVELELYPVTNKE